MDLKDSKTKVNLMRSFAGESQARNRYYYAAEVAKQERLYIIKDLFEYTADQEEAHGKVFYDFLKGCNGENISMDAAYPVDNYQKTLDNLKSAQHNELEEWDQIYKEFGKIAKEEGFAAISTAFDNIASIEKIHSDRFGKYVSELSGGMLFKKDTEIQWMCTNCGFIYEGKEAPKACPVCQHPQGYFMPFEDSEFQGIKR